MRTKTLNLAIGFIFLFLMLGILNIQVIKGKKYKELSNQNHIRLLAQEGARGRIFDREGNIIVDNRLSYNAMVLPQSTSQLNKTLEVASGVLDISFKGLKEVFRDAYTGSFMPTIIAKNIDVKKAIALEELKQDLGNIMIQPEPLRYYPYSSLACHVIGYLGEIDRWRLTKLADYGYKTKDIVGFGGLEEKYDYYLRQEEGGLSVEVDHRGKMVSVLGFRAPRNGKDIQLTLDLKVQKIIEDSLQDKKGSVILMDPSSGEIIAMASNPNFDPAVFLKNKKPNSYVDDLLESPEAPLMNRAISGVYPAGSLFKLVVAAASLETGKINSSTAFSCPGSMHIGRQQFSCWDTHNQQNLISAIANSCNVFFYRIGLLLGAQTIYDYGNKFGFSKATGIDLPYEASGFLPSPLWRKIYKLKNWYDGDTANLSIGQGELLVTPLQVARMMAVFANKGNLLNPHILKSVAGQQVHKFKRSAKLSLKDSTINYIRQGLRRVVTDPKGTGNVLSTLGVSIAGKTGTAQVSYGQSHGWFVGFFPYQQPKFVICVFLEHGGSGHAASVVAKQIIEKMLQEGAIDAN